MDKIVYKLFFVFCLFIVNQGLSQPKPKQTNPLRSQETEGFVSFGIQLNAINYIGDIPAGISFTRPGASVFVSRKLGPAMHARLSLSWAWLEGDDASTPANSGTYARNLHFRNFIQELALTTTYDLRRSYGKYLKRRWFTPYLVAGIAILHHNPQAKTSEQFGSKWVDLQPLGTEGQGRPGYAQPYNKIQLAIPLGLGLKWRVNQRWDFGIEVVPRFTFTDYLDDVSGYYPNMTDLGNPLAVAMSNRTVEPTAARTGEMRDLASVYERFGDKITYLGFDNQLYETVPSFLRGQSSRGNPKTKDFYIVTGFNLTYIMNVGLKCPQFR